MDNERPNERTSWSSRLEEPGALPGTGLTDKEAAWDKLYDRMKESETPRSRRMVWLWAAAACLLLIVIPAALLLKDRRNAAHPDPEKIPVADRSGRKPVQPAPAGQLSPNPAPPSMAVAPPRPGRREGITPEKEMALTQPRPTAPDRKSVV